ncbi:MAG: hypothetical protein IPI30_21815 [Saprospiraceae bacterium]|nr:hypothetical protein [Candidatus Vicinibacter affinis]
MYEFWRHAASKVSTDTVTYVALMVARFQILCTFIQSMPVQTSSFVLAHLLHRSVGAVRPGVVGPGRNPTRNGSFDPSTVGKFDFVYTAPNGCKDTRSIFVNPNPKILNPVPDTVCASMADWRYQVSIPNGDFYSSVIPINVSPVYMNSGDFPQVTVCAVIRSPT